MNIGILGTGVVAKTLAAKLGDNGHTVLLGTRDPKATLARNEKDMMGGPPVREFLETHSKVGLVTFAEAARHGTVVINALNGAATLAGLESAGRENLAEKVLLDLSNPLDFSRGMPPTLFVANTDSLAEQVQRAFPDAKVVKTLNTVNAYVMVEPAKLAEGDHSMFVAGNDAEARAFAATFLREEFGWRDVVDMGDITNARALEMWVIMWVRLYGALKNGMINLKLVR